jgi:hypothetical protein
LFICTIALLLKKDKYESVKYLLHNKFLVYIQNYQKTEVFPFPAMNPYFKSFDHRNSRLNLNRFSIKADLIKENVNSKYLNFEEQKQADLIMYYVSCLLYNSESYYYPLWYPTLYIYGHSKDILFEKMISKRIFDNAKLVLGVMDLEELKNKMNEIKDKDQELRISQGYRLSSILML